MKNKDGHEINCYFDRSASVHPKLHPETACKQTRKHYLCETVFSEQTVPEDSHLKQRRLPIGRVERVLAKPGLAGLPLWLQFVVTQRQGLGKRNLILQFLESLCGEPVCRKSSKMNRLKLSFSIRKCVYLCQHSA